MGGLRQDCRHEKDHAPGPSSSTLSAPRSSATSQKHHRARRAEQSGRRRATTQFGKAISMGVEYELHCDASLSDKCRKRLVWVMHGPFPITATDRAQGVETTRS